MKTNAEIVAAIRAAMTKVEALPLEEKVKVLNEVRAILHEVSPFNAHPIDCVQWVKTESVAANHYNPNVVAPIEMQLLKLSVQADGYTQPIVVHPDRQKDRDFTVVDGFHRTRVGKEDAIVREQLHGYLPVTTVRSNRGSIDDRIAATIRHNRARGHHNVAGMSSIVGDLAQMGWTDGRIARELGMEREEVLRLKQITGLAALFADTDYSEAWDVVNKDVDQISRPPRKPTRAKSKRLPAS